MRKVLVFLDNPRVYTGWSEKAARRTDRFQTAWLDDDSVVHIGEQPPETKPKRKTAGKKAALQYTPKPKAPRQADESDDLDDLMAGFNEQLHAE
jgi:hypothetical protein